MISPDAPISHEEDDKLMRTPFAKALARAVISAAGEESFVVGIHGRWGSGKSSVLNLFVEQLNERMTNTAEQMDVLRFNPWNFADQHHLVLQFFRQLTGHLRKLDKKSHARIKNLIETFDAYAQTLAPPLEALPYAKLPLLGLRSGIGIARRAMRIGGDMDSLYNSIAHQLRQLKRKMVVIIDDIDRLTASEIRQIFQLVKISARFPLVIYVLAFDREAVARALEGNGTGSGADYLEKIVQVSFDLPPISESVLTAMISQAIDGLLKQYPAARFDPHRFGNMFYAGIRQSFESLRDVRRFLNGLEFGFGMIGLELNAVDFIGVEALRAFHPSVFEVVRNNKKLFASHIDAFDQEAGHQTFRERVEKALPKGADLEKVKDLLVELFPKLAYAWGNTLYGAESEQEWEKGLRVASSRYFDLYFQLALPPDEVSVAEIGELIGSASDPAAFEECLRSFLEPNRIENAISSFRHKLSDLPAELLPNTLSSLIALGDAVKHEGSPLFGKVPEYWHVRWAILDVMDKIPVELRFQSLTEKFKASFAVGTMADIVVLFEDIKAKRQERYPDLSDEVLAGLKAVVCERIQDVSREDQMLLRLDALPSVLWAWKNWGRPDAPRTFVGAILKDPAKMVSFVDKFIYQVHSAGLTERVVNVSNQLNVKQLAEWADLKELTERLRSMDAASLLPEQAQIVGVAKAELERFEASGQTPEIFTNSRRTE